MSDVAAPAASAADHRARLADTLVAGGYITTPEGEAAVRRVPREAFAPPGTGLAAAYADDTVVTRRHPDGHVLSAISAPWLQARMIAQAGVQAGWRVLEIGSGGYNAALLAEIVGPAGAVTTVDIDPDVISRARRALDDTGYPHVTTVVADGEYGHLPHAPYDAIIVTVETSDVPPAWIEQLAPHGVLVAPMRLRGITRSIAFTRDGDRLVAQSMLMCGFVPMQGAGNIPEQRVPLAGDVVVVRLDDETTNVDANALAEAIRGPRSEVWSGVTMPGGVSFETLLLWLTGQPVPYGRLFTDRDRATDLFDGVVAPFAPISPAFLTTDSLAYLVLRKLDTTISEWEFGAHGFGPHATTVATRMCDAIRAWDRHAPDPQIVVHPGADALVPGDGATRLVIRRRHTTIAITWCPTA